MAETITIPLPEELRKQIDARRIEIADLKRLYRMATTAQRIGAMRAVYIPKQIQREAGAR
jgi:hypothetical protein